MRRQSTCLRLMELQGGRSTAVVSRQARPRYRLRPRRCRTRSGRLKGMSASASCLQRRLRCLQHSRRSMPLEMTPHEQRWPRRTGKRSERATTTICATTRTAAQNRPTVDNINRRPRMCAACVQHVCTWAGGARAIMRRTVGVRRAVGRGRRVACGHVGTNPRGSCDLAAASCVPFPPRASRSVAISPYVCVQGLAPSQSRMLLGCRNATSWCASCPYYGRRFVI